MLCHLADQQHGERRCSLLIREAGPSNVLARGRVTLVGNARRVDKPTDIGDCFLRKNPAARQYADFGDFSFWRIEISSVRYIGGFGRMSWLDLESWREAREDAVAVSATRSLIADLNKPEKTKKLAAVAKTFSCASTVASVSVTAVDQYGFEVDAETEHGIRPIRVAFKRRAKDADDVDALVHELEKLAHV
jgi:heme iron utilization protein